MSLFFFWRILSLCLLLASSVLSWELSQEEAETIGQKIYFNECRCSQEKLVWWNEGEDFASLGIGHFIWYPEHQKGRFEETFTILLAFFIEQRLTIPDWLNNSRSCPWNSKEEFLDPKQTEKKKELQTLLAASIADQARFIAKRFEHVLSQLVQGLNDEKKIGS